MNEIRPVSFSERLRDSHSVERCFDAMSNSTIRSFYGNNARDMINLLALPSSKYYRIKSNSPLSFLGTSFSTDTLENVSIREKNEIEKKAFDLILQPLYDCDFKHPLFNFTTEGLIEFLDDNSIAEKDKLIEDKCYSVILKQYPYHTINNLLMKVAKLDRQRANWLYIIFTNIFSNLNEYEGSPLRKNINVNPFS